MRKEAGVSDLTEITDLLSRLAPIDRLRGVATLLSSTPNVAKLPELVNSATSVGGIAKAVGVLDEHRKLLEGYGKRPCEYHVEDGRLVPHVMGVLVASDSSLAFVEETVGVRKVLQELGLSYTAVRVLRFADFRAAFAPLLKRHPGCKFDMRLVERTDLVYARDAAGHSFRLRIERHSQPQ